MATARGATQIHLRRRALLWGAAGTLEGRACRAEMQGASPPKKSATDISRLCFCDDASKNGTENPDQ